MPITDVHPVRVGQVTVIEGEDVRTGATAILPHPDNVYQNRVPAGIAVGNGYGKLMGSTQIRELGEIETPVVLTNTLCVPRAADAILDWTLTHPGNDSVTTVNPVVGETNDSRLNNIRRRALTAGMIHRAIREATPGTVAEGSVGAGTGDHGLWLERRHRHQFPGHPRKAWEGTRSGSWCNPISAACSRSWVDRWAGHWVVIISRTPWTTVMPTARS